MGKRKSRKKKKESQTEPEVKVSIKPDRSGSEVLVAKVDSLEPIEDEEPMEVKQSFTDPTQNESGEPKHEEGDSWEDVQFAVAELPSPLLTPTQRQYGEEFLPEYTKIRNKLRRLVGLLNGLP